MTRMIALAAALFFLAAIVYFISIDHSKLKPFTTDGCSSFPDGTWQYKDLWQRCCVAHDQAYWLGGSYQQRLQADKQLQQCVASLGQPEVAALMLAGVRVGGSPYWPTQYRWGYGWPYPRGYRTLSPEELRLAEQYGLKE